MTDILNVGARPGTSDGSTPTVLARSSRSTNPRRHSAILDHATSFIPRGTAPIMTIAGMICTDILGPHSHDIKRPQS